MGLLRCAELLLLAALLATPLPAAAQGRTIYCCEDSTRRAVCGDVLPKECYGQAYREISPLGTVRRHVPAPLTTDEIARRDAAAQRRKDEEAHALKQRRLDQALLETYPSLDDIDVREERAVGEVQRNIDGLLAREAELLAKRKRYGEEVEFYRGRDLPRDLVSNMRALDSELAFYTSVREAKVKELEAVRAKFAADRRRYAELLLLGEGRR
jgi:hypothetical protein